MKGWNLIVGDDVYSVYEPRIYRRLSGLNYAEFNITNLVSVGTSVSLTFGDATIFNGSISEIKRVSNGEYFTKIVEFAYDLKIMYVHLGVAGTSEENRVFTVNNDAETKTMADYIGVILHDTGWTDGTNDTRTTNPISENAFSNVAYNNTTCYDALEQFVCNTCGYHLWFNKSSKTIYYGAKGTLGVDREDQGSIDSSIVNVNDVYSGISYGVDRIIVVSNVNTSEGAKYEGAYPTEGLPEHPKTLIYQYNQVSSDEEAATIAKQIYNDRNRPKERFEIQINPSIMNIYEGDLITFNDISYTVVDSTITDESVVLGIKSSEENIFDKFGSQIQLVEGRSIIGTEVAWDGGWQEIPKRDVNYPGYAYVDVGDHGTWNFNITNIDYASDMHMTINTDCYLQTMSLGDAYTGVSVNPVMPSGYVIDSLTGNVVMAPSALSYIYTANEGPIHFGDENIFDGSVIEFNNNYTTIIEINIPSTERLQVPMEIGLANVDMLTSGAFQSSRMIEIRIMKYHEVNGWSVAHQTQPGMFLPGGSLTPLPIDVVILLPYESEPDKIATYRVEARVVSDNAADIARVRGVSFNLQQIGAHNHPSEITNMDVPIVDNKHGHPEEFNELHPDLNDTPHGTPIANTINPTNTYPEDIELYLFNTKYPPGDSGVGGKKLTDTPLHVGGKSATFTLDISKDDFAEGQNTFRMYSSSPGRGQIVSTYTAYGS